MIASRRLVPALVAIIAVGAAPAEESGWHFEAPNVHIPKGVLTCTDGFVASDGARTLIADAVRWDQHRDELFATGNVVFVQPGVRIRAASLGMHPDKREGEAWDIEAFIETRGRTVRARARVAEIERERITLRDVESDLGYGGILSYTCPTVRVYLYDKPRHDREGPEEYVSGLEIIQPTVRILHVPALWLPYLYRDFTLDYPWSKVMAGSARRLGYFVHYWVGSNLPAFAGWHTRLEARGDLNSRSGQGFGLNGFWKNDDFGHGQFEYFEMPKETVYGGQDDKTIVDERRARLFDIEHQIDLGHGAAYARFVEQPAPDPVPAGFVPPPGQGMERFRTVFLRDDVDHRPFARDSVALAYGFPIGTVVVDTIQNPRPEYSQSERWFGLHAESTPIQLAGPAHLGISAWEEDLHRPNIDTSADRFRGDANVGGMQWLDGAGLGGIGIDATGGARNLAYDNGRILGVTQESSGRHVTYANAGARIRFADDEESWSHVFTPRFGIDITSPGYGDVLPNYGFGDPGDRLEEDQRYYTAGFETALIKDRHMLSARLNSRWAMREQDRLYTDDLGVVHKGQWPLADVTAQLDGDIGKVLSLTGTLTYDARPQRITDLNAYGNLVINRHLSVHHLIYLQTDEPGVYDRIANEPGVSVKAERYRVDGSITMTAGGKAIDIWFLQLTRDMVDGELTLSYEYQTNASGGVYDQRFGIGFTLVGTHPDSSSGIGRGASYTLR
jgi:hypothetical protein